jgi:hypothetical protein
MKTQNLWYAVLMVAAFCSVNLDALPVGNTNDACVVNDAYESDLFEGDLKVSIETIRQFYDLNETQDKELTAMLGGNSSNHVGTRAAIRVTSRLWMNATVPYLFDLRQSTYSKLSIIRNAMDEWECSTCLRFVPRISHNDYVNFTDADCNRCYSHIGQYPSKRQQEINLGEGCFTHRTVLHEIGHALGYWHEHTRPDRDSYVNVIDNNIIPRKRTNFMKRTVNEVDSRGFGYDYSSVMHYHSDAFALRGNTLEVNNDNAYEMQGSPPFGHLPHLSSGDIDQTNHLYSCPEPGGNGFLMVEIYSGKNLENKDTNDAPDPYVQVVAVSSTGLHFYRQTSTQTDNLNPTCTWKELLLFSNRRWQSIRIKVWDEDDGTDDSISIMTQTVPLVDRYKCKNWRQHCTNTNCDSYVWYRYKLKAPIHGLLRVNIQYARNLPNTDVGYARRRALTKPDPYVKVTIVMPSGSHYTKSTAIKVETQNPTWNERLDMKEECEWVIFKVQIWDDDGSHDDKMSDPEYIEISPSSQYVSVEDHKHCAYGSDCDAYLYLDYEFVPDGDECSPNPCLNGGTCTDGCASYTCFCVYPYTGPNCEYRFRHRVPIF